MKRRMLAFIIALVSFMPFLPVKAELPSVDAFEKEFVQELAQAERNLDGLETLVTCSGRTAVVGDLHGDLGVCMAIICRLSREMDAGAINNVIFLGDIMDRGENSALTLLEVIKFFNKHPKNVIILRGNHETMEQFASGKTPFDARQDKYFRNVRNEQFKAFFDRLPIYAIINKHTLAVHGGIPARDLWDTCLASMHNPPPKEQYDDKNAEYNAAFSAMWADYNEKRGGSASVQNSERLQGMDDYRLIYYNEDSSGDFREILNRRLGCSVEYFVRGHQPRLGPFWQSPNGMITNVFSATQNQGSIKEAHVVIVEEASAPPRDYFKVVDGTSLSVDRGRPRNIVANIPLSLLGSDTKSASSGVPDSRPSSLTTGSGLKSDTKVMPLDKGRRVSRLPSSENQIGLSSFASTSKDRPQSFTSDEGAGVRAKPGTKVVSDKEGRSASRQRNSENPKPDDLPPPPTPVKGYGQIWTPDGWSHHERKADSEVKSGAETESDKEGRSASRQRNSENPKPGSQPKPDDLPPPPTPRKGYTQYFEPGIGWVYKKNS